MVLRGAALILLLGSTSLRAAPDGPRPGDLLFTAQIAFPPIVSQGQAYPDIRPVFRLEYGGCLRGPLAFFDMDGVETFRLGAGVYYPDGCEGK